MSTEIYYFSGSGNSLYIAKELQKRIPKTKLISIASLLDRDIINIDVENIGFVFPIHGMTIPVPVKKIVKKLNPRLAKYFFAIATRGGTTHNAFAVINKILKKKSKILNSFFSINMFSNDPKLKDWKCPVTKDLEENEEKIKVKLNSIQKIILNREINKEEDIEGIAFSHNHFINFLLEGLIHFAMKYIVEFKGVNNYFYADKKCFGCGICEKVCLAKKINLINKKPVWQNNVKCHFCYACLNFCPRQAVQIKSKWYMKSYTQKNGRYSHPYATADEIAKQKCSNL